jgi:hypothetical protein
LKEHVGGVLHVPYGSSARVFDPTLRKTGRRAFGIVCLAAHKPKHKKDFSLFADRRVESIDCGSDQSKTNSLKRGFAEFTRTTDLRLSSVPSGGRCVAEAVKGPLKQPQQEAL